MSETKVMPCRCKHAFQDRVYGLGNRVWNYLTKKGPNNNPGWRCTVCGTVRGE